MKKIWETGRACSHNSANLAGAAQRPECAPEGSTTLNASTTPNVGKKRSRLLKVFAASGLAFFMGIGTLCGVLIAPANTLSINVGNANYPQDVLQFTAEQMNFDPETDETIFTTENGTEIKQHNVVASGVYTKLPYFSMGSYNGSAVNWIILAASSAGIGVDGTPAGTAIKNDNGKQVHMGYVNSSLASNQILCISQYAFNSTTLTLTAPAHADYSVGCGVAAQNLSAYAAAADQISDYVSSGPTLSINVASSYLSLGTTLGLNGQYGKKIVQNTAFNSNYVFGLTTSQYTSFVSSTSYKVPYSFTATSTAVNLIAANSGTLTNTVTSTFTYVDDGWYYPSGAGAANTKISYINSSGSVATHTIATYSASMTRESRCGYNGTTAYGMKASYARTFNTLNAYYRPAIVVNFNYL